MGGCLTVSDPITLAESDAQYNNDENNAHKSKECDTTNVYCSSSDWLKFPICCHYCRNHCEPSQEFQLVILGPGYTGKTTLRHHLVQRYGHAFCKADFLMYRDILQHNVLDLFRDLLEKPSLTFNELKQFIKYIHKAPDIEEYESEETIAITDIDDIRSSTELDVGLHDLSEDDELEIAYKYKQRYLSPKQIHSNSSSLRSLDTTVSLTEEEENKDIECEMISGMNDAGTGADDEAQYRMSNNKYKTPYSSPILMVNKSPSNTPSWDGLNNLKIDSYYEDDGDRYCALNQCSPTAQSDYTYDGYSPTPTLNPCVLSMKLDNVNTENTANTPNTVNTPNTPNSKWHNPLSALLNTFRSNDEEQHKEEEEDNKEHKEEQEQEQEEEYRNNSIHSIDLLIAKLKNEQLKYGRDNGEYLIVNSDRILSDSFEPTFIDLLQCHVRSTGLMFENHVICRSLPINKWPNQEKQDIVFRVVDVGGHRNERKKWSYVLKQQNDVIVFVVSAASFCQVLFEDFKKNAMRESITVWNDILSSHYESQSQHTQFILVINKIDLFYQRSHLFKEYFPEYQGDITNKCDILNYIKSLYLDIAKEYHQIDNVHCVCTKLTDCLEIAWADIHHIRHILMSVDESIHKDIVDTIIDYAIGDVFWSDKWLKPMWERRMNTIKTMQNKNKNKNKYKNKRKSMNHEPICDHINNPHDYHRHRKQNKKNKKRSTMSCLFQSH